MKQASSWHDPVNGDDGEAICSCNDHFLDKVRNEHIRICGK